MGYAAKSLPIGTCAFPTCALFVVQTASCRFTQIKVVSNVQITRFPSEIYKLPAVVKWTKNLQPHKDSNLGAAGHNGDITTIPTVVFIITPDILENFMVLQHSNSQGHSC